MRRDERVRQHPYILHPLRLMMRVETETEKIVAVLHEVVEDSQPPQRWGFDPRRREDFSESVLGALECVTRREGETCEDVIRRSLAHPVARRLKLADPRRQPGPPAAGHPHRPRRRAPPPLPRRVASTDRSGRRRNIGRRDRAVNSRA